MENRAPLRGKRLQRIADLLKGFALVAIAVAVGWRASVGLDELHASMVAAVMAGLFSLVMFSLALVLIGREPIDRAMEEKHFV